MSSLKKSEGKKITDDFARHLFLLSSKSYEAVEYDPQVFSQTQQLDKGHGGVIQRKWRRSVVKGVVLCS